jgi:hypothetical protein
MKQLRWIGLAVTMVLLCGVTLSIAQDEPATAPPAADEATEKDEATTANQSAEDVLNELMRRRAENPLIEPAQPRNVTGPAGADRVARPLGTAPGVKSTKLRREGQFIVSRRARMIRATGGATPWALSFDADKDGMQDPPMFLMPCQMLEDMETLTADRGDEATFIVSGQVFVYHNANYLLPTLMKLAPDRGNLQP